MHPLPRLFALGFCSAGLLLAQDRFSERLTAEERDAAGLNQLTTAQLSVLDGLVARQQRTAVAATPAPSGAKSARGTQSSAEPATNAAAAPADVSAAAQPEPASKRRLFGLPVRDETDAITGVIDGDFRGWSGGTMFRLQDGQIWTQADPTDHYDSKLLKNPSVKISKSMFGGYKMTIDGVPGWVRVRRIQ